MVFSSTRILVRMFGSTVLQCFNVDATSGHLGCLAVLRQQGIESGNVTFCFVDPLEAITVCLADPLVLLAFGQRDHLVVVASGFVDQFFLFLLGLVDLVEGFLDRLVAD